MFEEKYKKNERKDNRLTEEEEMTLSASRAYSKNEQPPLDKIALISDY